jgi:flagellar motor switch protein FliM
LANAAGGSQNALDVVGDSGDGRRLRPFDFRNPSKMGRDNVRRLELTHETFIRNMGAALSSRLRTMVRLELLAIDQVTYDEYVRSMPNPTVIAQIGLAPLPGVAMVEMSTSTALTLVDRLLGGIGKPGVLRRPTELESSLITEVVRHAEAALADTFEPLLAVQAELQGIEFNPNFVQATNPSEMVAVMSYSLAILEGHRSEGLLTLCYPFSLLMPAWEMAPKADERPPALGAGISDTSVLAGSLPEIQVPVTARLRGTDITAAELTDLQPGDVVRLDHRVDEPVLGVVEGSALLEGRLGRKGKNMALEISHWREA